ncbi:MAG TPA: phosphotransferase [Steroidobacteraceae bacterium]|nr:phosphotransferase [Steroidobacteraceae bacterium]
MSAPVDAGQAAIDATLLDRAFAALPMLGPRTGWQCTPMTGGIANRSWRIEAPGGRMVLRVPIQDTADLGVDRAGERAAVEAATAAGIAPPLIYFDAASGLMLSEFVAGRTWTHADAHDPKCLERLGARLKLLHALAPPADARRLAYAELIPQYRERRDERAAPQPASSGRFDTEADRRLKATAKAQIPGVLCHNDVHRRNLIDGKSLWLVDWEYAAVGDGLYDLASFACYHDIDAAERRILVTAYEARGTRQLTAALADYGWLFDYLHLLWLELTATDPAGQARLLERLGA